MGSPTLSIFSTTSPNYASAQLSRLVLRHFADDRRRSTRPVGGRGSPPRPTGLPAAERRSPIDPALRSPPSGRLTTRPKLNRPSFSAACRAPGGLIRPLTDSARTSRALAGVTRAPGAARHRVTTSECRYGRHRRRPARGVGTLARDWSDVGARLVSKLCSNWQARLNWMEPLSRELV